MLTKKENRIKIVTVLIVAVFMFGLVPQAVWAGQTYEQGNEAIPEPFDGYDLDWINIFYDSNDEVMTRVAELVHEVLSYRLNNVRLVQISSPQDVEYHLMDRPWMAIYAFDSNLTGVFFESRFVSWRSFSQMLSAERQTQHIVGMGNTLSLQEYLDSGDSHIHINEAQQTDAILLMMYDIWTAASIVKQKADVNDEYAGAAKDLRSIATKIYADNFNALFKAQAQPSTPVGQVDEDARKKRTEKMWEEHTPTIRPAKYRRTENGSLVEIPPDEVPEDFSPTMKISSEAELADDDFVLGELPLLSGLRGPIGDIVDILLELLTDKGKTVLSIPQGVMETVKEAFGSIQELVGLVDDFDAESVLKELLQSLANEFPFVEDLKPYLDVLVKLLFNLRGEVEDIVPVVTELIEGLLSDVLPPEALDMVELVLDMGSSLQTTIEAARENGKSIFNVLVSHFTDQLFFRTLNKTLVATLSMSQTNANTILTKADDFIGPLIRYIVSQDGQKLLEDLYGPLLQSVLGSVSSAAEEAAGKIDSVIMLGLTLTELVDDFDEESIATLLQETLIEIIGSSEITDTAENFAQDLLDVVKRYKEQSLSSVSDFRNEISEVIDNAVDSTVPSSTRAIIEDLVLLIAGFHNDGFSPSDVPDMFEIAEAILDESDLPTDTLNDLKDFHSSVVQPTLLTIGELTDNDGLRKLTSQTVSQFQTEFSSYSAVFMQVVEYFDADDYLSSIPNYENTLETAGQFYQVVIRVSGAARSQSFEGVVQSVWLSINGIIGYHPSFDNVPIDAYLDLLQILFPEAFGLERGEAPRPDQVIDQVMGAAQGELSGAIDPTTLEAFLELVMEVKGLFTEGLDWIVGKILDWLQGLIQPVIKNLEDAITSVLGENQELLGFHNTLPVGLGSWSLFDLEVDLGIIANFAIDASPLFDMVKSLILDARQVFSLDNLGDFFGIVFKFFEISPQFYAELGVAGFDTAQNPFMKFLLESLGVSLSFSGSAKFVLNLFTFKGGVFQWENFMRIVEWALNIKVEISRTFTLLDFLTGGVGGGALNSVAKFLGLDAITVTIFLGVELIIIKQAATATMPEVSTLTLILTLGATLHIGISIVIASLDIDGTLEIILEFFQNLANSAPMKITLRLILTLKIKITLAFSDIKKKWTWEVPGSPWDLSPKSGDEEYEESGVGFDSDGDGLSDTYEEGIPGLNPSKVDTDGDGASDKLEVQTMGTDATVPDEDNDGLLDGEEWELGTSPVNSDSDYDGVNDFDEVNKYKTDPLSQDTDGDALSDAYEIFTPWNISGITPTVTEVVIGGKTYNDRTDPLNPDTDGDGLVDGDEGPMGDYYGLSSLYNESDDAVDNDPLIFNEGYTHPLDSDTDDDSYLQLYNGDIDQQALTFLKDMNDGAEVAGFTITVYDEDGEPERKKVVTNPVNPDTDGDTGIEDRTPQPGAWINSDGYELAQTPPTDPTDGDSDDDGLIDGLEGVLKENSNHTNANDPDTDDDGLYDMEELLMGTDPRSADTDGDQIPDGEEFFTFFTNPRVADSDFDGVIDGEEVYLWHSNPLSDDSDGDGLRDGQEILVFGSDPMDEDGDNDGLSDFEEAKIWYTNPFEYDSDGDGLSDGEEALVWGSDPLNWDTDGDSIKEPNEDGEMTWPMNDYHEVRIYGTNVTDADSDLDGLGDGLELYLASGQIPWTEPIMIDPMMHDTDGDGLADGSEVRLKNVTDIIYPYRAETLFYPYNTSPTESDTDRDNITDYEEVMVWNSNPAHKDTDNDTLSDWQEIYVYNTSAIYNDTDGDGLLDNEESLTPVYPLTNGTPPFFLGAAIAQDSTYETDALNPDSDGDNLPDGSEVDFYGTSPTDSDSDGNGVPDGKEFDTDQDGLSDGLEFQIHTEYAPGGGFRNPDSDGDGLLDGDEYYTYGTSPTEADTDGDGYSDGTEISIGTDPLTYTDQETFELRLAARRGETTIDVLLPKNATEVYQDTPVRAVNYTTFVSMWVTYNNGSGWSEPIQLVYDSSTQQWYNDTVTWQPGEYELRVYGQDAEGGHHVKQVSFLVQSGYRPLIPMWMLLAIGAVAAVVVITIVGYKTGFIERLTKRFKDESDTDGKTESATTKDEEESPKDSEEGGD
ncbi:MAG: hypothetical protein KGY80_03720 [Candidatus Thorarchaeota archaeon]|nr:hypothetical protein [Candidatus Thorarchaeota archaeon]